jgi:hypothetical protein
VIEPEVWLITLDGVSYNWYVKQHDGSFLQVDDDYVLGPNWRDIPKEKVNPFAKSKSGSGRSVSTKRHTR